MASTKTKFSVGIFMAAGIVVLLVAIVWLGMTTVFEKGGYYVTYFAESIQGLDVDSPVKYRGVPVGRVESIELAPDGKLIQVTMRIDNDQKLDKGIVAQLKSVGITGTMLVELNQRDPGEADQSPEITFPAKYPVVPSKPSELSRILEGIESLVSEARALDFEGISLRLKTTLDNFNDILDDGTRKDIKGMVSRLDNMLEKNQKSLDSILGNMDAMVRENRPDIRRIVRHTGDMLEENRQPLHAAVSKLDSNMTKADALLSRSLEIVDKGGSDIDELKRSLLVTTRNLEQVSENLDRLMETLNSQPSQVIFSAPPEPRSVEAMPQ